MNDVNTLQKKMIRLVLPIAFQQFMLALVERFWQKTAPVLLNELVWGGGFTMYSVVMGHMGTDAVAANSIASISKNLVVRCRDFCCLRHHRLS